MSRLSCSRFPYSFPDGHLSRAILVKGNDDTMWLRFLSFIIVLDFLGGLGVLAVRS